MSFERAFARTMKAEGGYSDNPKDRGGRTYMGIASRKHPLWEGWQIIDDALLHGEPLSIAPGLADMVRQFYRINFWLATRCDQLDRISEAVAEELFEAGVNCGPGNGIKFLQRALNALNNRGTLYDDLYEDGAIGPKTIWAVKKCLMKRPPSLLVRCQNGEQYIHYKKWSQHEDFPGVFERT